MNLEIKHYPSRAKQGRAAFCVDTRGLLNGGKRNFYDSKIAAQKYIDKLSTELVSDSANSWDWTFEDLYHRFVVHVENQEAKGDISTSSCAEKKRDSKLLLGCMLSPNRSVANTKVRDLTAGDMRLKIVEQLRVGRTKKTVDNILGSVRYWFNYAIDEGCRNSNPALGVKGKGDNDKPAKEVARIQTELVDAIIEAMPQHWALIARFSAKTGLRQGELRCLTWGDIEFAERSRVHVTKAVKHGSNEIGKPKTKRGVRKVPLTPDMKLALQELHLASGRPAKTELVFPGRYGDPLGTNIFTKVLGQAHKKAGVERIRWHDLRHYYASRLLQKFGADWWTITNLMGHASISTTSDVYGHWLEDKERDDKIADDVAEAF